MLLQLAFTEEALAETHLIHITLDFCDEILYAFCASGTVFLDSLTELVARSSMLWKSGMVSPRRSVMSVS